MEVFMYSQSCQKRVTKIPEKVDLTYTKKFKTLIGIFA